MRVLIVDDNPTRLKEIELLLTIKGGLVKEHIFPAVNTQQAKDLMRNIDFDILILDVVLPKRKEIPNAKFGLQFLKDIKKRPTIKKPQKIIGITAHYADIDSFRIEFDRHCEVIIEASHRNNEWKKIILEAMKFENTKQISINTSKNKTTCLSVHGIRTHGLWQQDLKKIVESNVNTVKFENYKFGYFTIFSFFVPFLRKIEVKRFKKSLTSISNSNELVIFCHSFGTYIVVNAINDLLKDGVVLNIEKLVLAGSVLPSSYDFSLILDKTNAKIINDCGSQDNILLLSEAFIPNTGMAGRIGFFGLNNDRFSNRYFNGGHSHYFDLNTNFIEYYWLPLFSNNGNLNLVDGRKSTNVFSRNIEKFFSLLGKFKETIYISLFVYLIYLLYEGFN